MSLQQTDRKATRYPRIPKKPAKKVECPRCHQIAGVSRGAAQDVKVCLKCYHAWKVKV